MPDNPITPPESAHCAAEENAPRKTKIATMAAVPKIGSKRYPKRIVHQRLKIRWT